MRFMLAELLNGPEYFQRVAANTESLLTRLVGLLDGLVWYDGLWRGAVSMAVVLLVLNAYAEKVRRENR